MIRCYIVDRPQKQVILHFKTSWRSQSQSLWNNASSLTITSLPSILISHFWEFWFSTMDGWFRLRCPSRSLGHFLILTCFFFFFFLSFLPDLIRWRILIISGNLTLLRDVIYLKLNRISSNLRARSAALTKKKTVTEKPIMFILVHLEGARWKKKL